MFQKEIGITLLKSITLPVKDIDALADQERLVGVIFSRPSSINSKWPDSAGAMPLRMRCSTEIDLCLDKHIFVFIHIKNNDDKKKTSFLNRFITTRSPTSASHRIDSYFSPIVKHSFSLLCNGLQIFSILIFCKNQDYPEDAVVWYDTFSWFNLEIKSFFIASKFTTATAGWRERVLGKGKPTSTLFDRANGLSVDGKIDKTKLRNLRKTSIQSNPSSFPAPRWSDPKWSLRRIGRQTDGENEAANNEKPPAFIK